MRLFKKLTKKNDPNKHYEEIIESLDLDSTLQQLEYKLKQLENGEVCNPNDFPKYSDRYHLTEKWRDIQIARLKQEIEELNQQQEKNRSI